jgi:trehalose 6-phosphate synthase/phosphatase
MVSENAGNSQHQESRARIVIVSNRLSTTVTKDTQGLHFSPSVGGLATGLATLSGEYNIHWVGWPGIAREHLTNAEKDKITKEQTNTHSVFLSSRQIEDFYEGFANKTLWPLFHYFPSSVVYKDRFWDSYRQVNEEFCNKVASMASPDDCIWVHDYHLMLLPKMLRDKMPDAKIGFFLHIPFPSSEIFRMLPWRREILDGLLGADLVGFHTYDYVSHFLNSASRIAGFEHSTGALTVDNRFVKAEVFPMGIDYEKYSQASKSPVAKQYTDEIRQRVGNRKIIISIDRLDYTKGIVERLDAYERFLERNPEYKEKVTLILLAVPSRQRVETYIRLRERIERLISKINGENGTIGWVPVWYLYRSAPFEQLVALYSVADVALLTPLRDGMNLIAKEFIAARTDGSGVLVLSEMAGAASELGEAIIVNPQDINATAKALADALKMPLEEQIFRNTSMQQRLSRYTVKRWVADFIDTLKSVKIMQHQLSVNLLTQKNRNDLIERYQKSTRRLLLLDYDGTLVGFAGRPEEARPGDELVSILKRLASDPANAVVIISGRDRHTLKNLLGSLGVSLVAEHGAWFCRPGQQWQELDQFKSDWKQVVLPVLQLFCDRTPGTYVEEKDFSLVWHYRRANAEMADVRIKELKGAVSNLIKNLGVGIYEGNKIIEVKNTGISKGRITEQWLKSAAWDFILAAGDDFTDEQMFAVLPPDAVSIKIGLSISKARFNVDTVRDFRTLLKTLAGTISVPNVVSNASA